MGVIIDTSAFVELERNRENWQRLSKVIGTGPAFLPSIVWAELMVGVHLADTVERALKRKGQLERLRQRIAILPFTFEVAEVWAELFAELRRTGAMIPANDLCVISTAVFHGHQILISSRDEDHFRRIPRARVIKL